MQGTEELLDLAGVAPPGDAVIDLTDDAGGAGRAGEAPLAGFVDARTGVRFELHHPLQSPLRWREYLDGAEQSYRRHGVERVLDLAGLADGRRAALFFVALDPSGRAVGGIRAHGPLRVVEEAHALDELKALDRLPEVRGLLARAIPAGVVEIKGAWIDRDAVPDGVSDGLARCHVHAMRWLGARFALCTCSELVAARWTSAGGRRFAGLDPVAFPDDRYRTVLLWWDGHHVADRATPAQWDELVLEHRALQAVAHRSAPEPSAGAAGAHRAEVLDERDPVDAGRVAALASDPSVVVLDHLERQREALREVLLPPGVERVEDAPRWAWYPWRRTLVHVLGPEAFRTLRLDRNRNKITLDEQARLARLRIGVVGLSVGHAIAHVLALEGICGELRLADFDEIELSNLNRIPATVLDLGLNKAVVAARRIAELDPYLRIEVETAGLTTENLDGFVAGLDVVVEECDSLDVKALLRDAARRAGIPVLMETSDRGLLDVERFDLEPDRPLFHGLLGAVEASELVGLSTHDKVPHVLRILEPDQLSSRMAASMAEIDETVTTWPQLGGDVMLGGATIAAAVRALATGRPLPSGRVRIDLADALAAVATPEPVAAPSTAAGAELAVPEDPRRQVARAAHLAPSGGNVQPWTLTVDDEGLTVRLDRSLSVTMDVAQRGSLVAAGAALFNARVAAAALGVLGPVEVGPTPDDPDRAGVLRWGTGADPELAARLPGVLARTSNRRPGHPAPIPAEVAERLGAVVAAEGATLHHVVAPEGIAEYAELLAESDRLRFLSPRLHAEMVDELRWPPHESVQTGIDVRTLELDPADLAKLSVARRADVMAELASWDGGRALGDISRDRIPTSSAIAAVSLDGASEADHVRGGAAVEALWVAAEAAGLAVQPVSPVSVYALGPDDLEALVPEPFVEPLGRVTLRLRRLLGVGDRPLALVLRLSHAGPVSTRSERRPLGEVLRP